MPAEVIFFNGRFMPAEEAKVSVSSPGFLYGWGLFETMRAYQGEIIYFDAHLRRIAGSCRVLRLGLPYPPDKLKRIIKKALELNYSSDTCARLAVWKAEKGTGISVSVKKYTPHPAKKYRDGFSACVSRFRQNENSLLARLKSANYLLCRLSSMEAEAKGFDEALILNNKGYIAEASRSNIFLIKDNALFTPALSCGCLDGITRRLVLDLAKKYNIAAREGDFTLQDLFSSDAAFLTNSLIGIMPLGRLNNKRITRPGNKITGFFIRKYRKLLYAD